MGDTTSHSFLPGNPEVGSAGHDLIHPSHVCQIGESDQGPIASQGNSTTPNGSRIFILRAVMIFLPTLLEPGNQCLVVDAVTPCIAAKRGALSPLVL
jgi:hypothetical protein